MGSTSKTKTEVAPPSWAQGTINNALGAEQSGYDSANATYKQFQPAMTSAIQNTANLAAHPAQFQTDAQNQLDKTINGDYLTPSSNPYSAGMAKQIADQTNGQYNASFGASGRSHGGLAAMLSSQGVGNALDNFYGGIYNNERGLQQSAIGMTPAMNADQYTGANQLMSQVGTASMTPEQIAALFGGSVAGTVGPYGTTTTSQHTPFGLQQAIGLAMAAAGAATGNPSAAMGGLNMAGSGGQSAPPPPSGPTLGSMGGMNFGGMASYLGGFSPFGGI